MWNNILSNSDIEILLHEFGRFHDSCIKELRYVSGAFVDANLSMLPFNTKRTVSIVFQRQRKNPAAIEMEFTGLVDLHLAPKISEYVCVIHDATFYFKDNLFYWGDCGEFTGTIREYSSIWICAEAVRWHALDNCLGEDDVYIFHPK
jgi:hypothetical protein